MMEEDNVIPGAGGESAPARLVAWLPGAWFAAAILTALIRVVSRPHIPDPQTNIAAYDLVQQPGSEFQLPIIIGMFGLFSLRLRKGYRNRTRIVLAWTHYAAALFGVLLIEFPAIALSVIGRAKNSEDTLRMFTAWNAVVAIGYALFLVSCVLFLVLAFLASTIRLPDPPRFEQG